MKETVLKVEGMMCEGCENRIKNALSTIDGVKSVKADHKTGIVTVEADENVAKDTMEEAIVDIGFDIVKE